MLSATCCGKVFFIQQNFKVGDITGNADLIINNARQAASLGADVVLTPELALSGYPAEDLLYSPDFQRLIQNALQRILANAPPNIALLVGLPLVEGETLYNGCVLIRNGEVIGTHKKSSLPNYSVFDERRYFDTVVDNPVFTFTASGETYAVLICEELWTTTLASQVMAAAATHTLVLNGSPFFVGKQAERHAAAAAFARATNTAVFYANMVGGQDELVFDGASFVMDASGALVGQLPAFDEVSGFAMMITAYPNDDEAMYAALKLGLHDYLLKSDFADGDDGVLLGLSGGVDSALVAVLAADVLGKERVMAIMMPTQYTSADSLTDAARLAENLGIRYLTLPISDAIDSLQQTAQPALQRRDNDITAENLQARLRGTLLMTVSNNRNLLLLATGNKSEMAVGYATLYGDMNGGFAPIKDVLKTQVWNLCRYRNSLDGVIPERIISRAPSAELRADQTDQDTLPPYEVLDAMLADHLARLPLATMRQKYDKIVLADFHRRLLASEYKRRQSPPGTKVSATAFGRDWRMPIASKFSYA